MSDLINRQDAIDALCDEYCGGWQDCRYYPKCSNLKAIQNLPSAQPEYYDYSDIEDTWNYYAEENDINLTANAKQIKNAMWVGYRKGKESAQTERKKGEWIYVDGVNTFECTVCGRQMVRNIFDYCPWCGARMEVEDGKIH